MQLRSWSAGTLPSLCAAALVVCGTLLAQAEPHGLTGTPASSGSEGAPAGASAPQAGTAAVAAPPATFATCQPARGAAPVNDPVALRVRAYADVLFRERGISGVALVAKGGAVVLEHATGLASREAHEAMRPTHRFLIASLTKEWTAVATLLWAKRRQLPLDSTLEEWFPEVQAWRGIRLQWLLEHRSGMPRSASAPGNAWNSEQSAARCARERLAFIPGTAKRYSNCGYSVLGRLLELGQQASFAEIIERDVLVPLQMSDSGISKPDVAVPALAQGYTSRGAKLIPVRRAHSFGGAGGGYSSARDLCTFALSGAALAGAEAVPFVESHTGRLGGFDSYLVIDRDAATTIVYLTNRDDTPLERIDRDLRALARGQEVAARGQ